MPTIMPQVRAFAAMRGFDADLLALPIRLAGEAEELPKLSSSARRRVTVYLDTKDWINLARARLGQPEGRRYVALYEGLKARAAAGEILVPLCATTYMELAKNPHAKQRSDLAAVIAEISGFATLVGSRFAVAHQVRTSIASLVGARTPEPFDPFSFGSSYAFSDRRQLVLRRRDGHPVDMSDPELREIVISARALAEFELLLAPRPEDLAGLRANGYHPEKTFEIHNRRLAREHELAALLVADPSHRARLTDIVAARYLHWELQDHVASIAPEFGLTPTEFYRQGKDWLTSLAQRGIEPSRPMKKRCA